MEVLGRKELIIGSIEELRAIGEGKTTKTPM